MPEEKVIFTGKIPQCPYCKRQTKRGGGIGNTLNGIKTAHWDCYACGKNFTIAGNETDGYYYK